jgi:hypothetical protein
MRSETLLSKLYYDTKTGYISPQKLYEKAKTKDPDITLKTIKEWYSKQIDIQQFQEKRSKLDSFKITSQNPNSWQMDLAFIERRPILTALNINSRIGFAKLLSNKKANTILSALKHFVKQNDVKILTSDNGSEFMNQLIQAFLKKSNIEHFNNEPGDHNTMGKIERFNRTLKQRFVKIEQALTQKLLTDVISNYNNTFHSSIGASPNEMKGQVIHSELQHNKVVVDSVSNEFNIGDSVRYKLKPKTFGKEGAKWSKSVYEIVGMDGYKLHLRSKNNHVLYKSPIEIKNVKAEATDAPIEGNQIWEVDKLLDHKKLKNDKYKYLIQWKGFDEPSWESQDNLRLINKNQMSELEKEYFRKHR